MRNLLVLGALAVLLPAGCTAQEAIAAPASPVRGSIDSQMTSSTLRGTVQLATAETDSSVRNPLVTNTGSLSERTAGRFSYYMKETFLNPSVLTAPVFTASIHMANPPGRGPTRYPGEWRQGAEAFGRNLVDAFTTRTATHTGRLVAGELTREDPRYLPSSRRNFLVRSSHAVAFTFVDRSDSGGCMPAWSNMAGAAAGGFVGNAYLPDGFRDITHAGQRATFQFGMVAAGNLFREFAPQMPVPLRAFLSLLAR